MVPIPDHDNSAVLKKQAQNGSMPPAPSGHGPAPATCPPGPDEKQPFAACPGSAARTIDRPDSPGHRERGPHAGMGMHQPSGTTGSALRQWPVQLVFMNPNAGCFENGALLIAADCTPFAYAGFYAVLLAGKILIIFFSGLDLDLKKAASEDWRRSSKATRSNRSPSPAWKCHAAAVCGTWSKRLSCVPACKRRLKRRS